jgi:hypothetical protein
MPSGLRQDTRPRRPAAAEHARCREPRRPAPAARCPRDCARTHGRADHPAQLEALAIVESSASPRARTWASSAGPARAARSRPPGPRPGRPSVEHAMPATAPRGTRAAPDARPAPSPAPSASSAIVEPWASPPSSTGRAAQLRPLAGHPAAVMPAEQRQGTRSRARARQRSAGRSQGHGLADAPSSSAGAHGPIIGEQRRDRQRAPARCSRPAPRPRAAPRPAGAQREGIEQRQRPRILSCDSTR